MHAMRKNMLRMNAQELQNLFDTALKRQIPQSNTVPFSTATATQHLRWQKWQRYSTRVHLWPNAASWCGGSRQGQGGGTRGDRGHRRVAKRHVRLHEQAVLVELRVLTPLEDLLHLGARAAKELDVTCSHGLFVFEQSPARLLFAFHHHERVAGRSTVRVVYKQHPRLVV